MVTHQNKQSHKFEGLFVPMAILEVMLSNARQCDVDTHRTKFVINEPYEDTYVSYWIENG